jgi:outer membrane protein, multidrug efflux system
MRKLIWSLSYLIILTGCLRPHYTPQYVRVPEQWRIEADEGSTLCNQRWWEQFQDIVLDGLIETALRNNQDLQIAISRVFEYYARLGVTHAALYPTVNGNASYTRTQSSLVTLGSPPENMRINNNFRAYVSLAWELDFWGRLRSASDAAYADLLRQVEIRRGVVVSVVASVARAYITLRALDLQLEISKKTLQTRLDSLRLAQSRFELGETSEIEVKQAESEVEVAAIRVIAFERAVVQQENLLSILIGDNPRDIERGAPLYFTRRPDIAAAENLLIAANARVSQARALFFPQINLTGLYGSESRELKDFLTGPSEIWQYGLSAVQIIFDAGKTGYLVDEAKALRDEALFQYRQTILTAFREVEDALIATIKNKELVNEHEKQVKVLSDYLHLAQLRYAEGEIDYLNVLDAERSLFNAQLDLVQAQADSFIAIVNLYSALGGGWVDEADAEALSQVTCNE